MGSCGGSCVVRVGSETATSDYRACFSTLLYATLDIRHQHCISFICALPTGTYLTDARSLFPFTSDLYINITAHIQIISRLKHHVPLLFFRRRQRLRQHLYQHNKQQRYYYHYDRPHHLFGTASSCRCRNDRRSPRSRGCGAASRPGED